MLLTVFNNINQETRKRISTILSSSGKCRSGRVDAVELAGINITGIRSDNSQFRTIMPLIGDDQLMNDLFENNVEIIANEPEQQSIWTQLLVASFPILIIMRCFSSSCARCRVVVPAVGVARCPSARARPNSGRRSDQVTFADVAGVEEAKEDVEELVEFLRERISFSVWAGRSHGVF